MQEQRRLMLSVLLMLTACCATMAQRQMTTAQLSPYYQAKTHQRVSIHDPSIYYDSKQKLYHLQGTHLGSAVSSDLVNWSYAGLDFATQDEKGRITTVDFTQAFSKNMTTSVRRTLNGVTETVPFGNFDAAEWRSAYGEALPGNVWAPDVIYNEHLQKWCYYVALNGTWGRSDCVIVMCSGNSPTGPFVYQGPVVYSGFTNSWDPVISWKKTDLEVVLGPMSQLPDRYDIGDAWGWTWPNCIDPSVFYDEEGQLWMCYGSFFGGIYILKLDNTTGLRDYTYTYDSDYYTRGAACRTDAYFGYKIAGGLGVTGEGPYIQHFGKYYYLFMTYGSLDIYGGYEMRIFRSERPQGPYYDYEGMDAAYDVYEVNNGGGATTDRGDKLMGAYNQWGMMTLGEVAQGHCSATIDAQGRYLVFYHTRFNDGVGNGHEVRTHQLFINENNMLVAAPFEFDGETVTQDSIESCQPFTNEQIAGEYHVLLHPYRLNNTIPEDARPGTITLSADGKVTGDYKGTWRLKAGTSYITLALGTQVYKGVLVEQTVDQTNMKAIAFTTVSTHGVPVWGYKLTDECALAYNQKRFTMPVNANQYVSGNLNLSQPTTDNVVLTWTSTEPDVISPTGRYTPRDTVVDLTLTARLTCGDIYWERSVKVKAKADDMPDEDILSGLVARYDFEQPSVAKNVINGTQLATRTNETKGIRPTLEDDAERDSRVLHQYFGFPNANSTSFTRMDNPLLGCDNLQGFTISMWVKREDGNMWDALWGFTSSRSCKSDGPRLFLTGNNYIEYNDGEDNYMQINYPRTETYVDIPVAEWALITHVFTPEGVTTYRNGTKRAAHSFKAGDGTKAATYDYQPLLDFVKTCKYFYLGNGSFNGSTPAFFDDIMIYNRPLTSAEVTTLKMAENRTYDWLQATGIHTLRQPVSEEAAFELRGLPHSQQSARRGIYIKGGKKYLQR